MSGPAPQLRNGGQSRAVSIRRLPSLSGRRTVEAQSLTQPQPHGSTQIKRNDRPEVMEAALDANGDRGNHSVPPGSQGNFPKFPSTKPRYISVIAMAFSCVIFFGTVHASVVASDEVSSPEPARRLSQCASCGSVGIIVPTTPSCLFSQSNS